MVPCEAHPGRFGNTLQLPTSIRFIARQVRPDIVLVARYIKTDIFFLYENILSGGTWSRVEERSFMKRKKLKYFDNVWAAVGYPPVEANNLSIRSHLMILLEQAIKKRGLTQAAAAKLFGVSQPRVSDLTRGRIDKFSIDALVQMAHRAGYVVTLSLEGAA
jgi:predicted XRE-type DNA-binding protein